MDNYTHRVHKFTHRVYNFTSYSKGNNNRGSHNYRQTPPPSIVKGDLMKNMYFTALEHRKYMDFES